MSTATPTTLRLLSHLQLHSFPSAALRVMNMLTLGTPDLSHLASVINTDAMLAAAVLHTANTAQYNHHSTIHNIETALQILGIDTTDMLVLAYATYSLVSPNIPRDIGRRWWRHNFATALYSQHLSTLTTANLHGYLPGLMHSIGQLALLQSYPTQYPLLVASPAARQFGIFKAERTQLDTDHCQLGAALLTRWQLPANVIDAAQHHHLLDQAHCLSTHLIQPSCHLANISGFQLFANQPDEIDTLPASTPLLPDDLDLRDTITRTVASMEAQLFSHN